MSPRLGLRLRVGYVNINGLAVEKWEHVTKLLHSTFDLLFVAETWYVAHRRRLRDRRLVVSTVKPTVVLPKGRFGGGIYLLANEATRGRMRGLPTVTANSITFEIDGVLVSGLYEGSI